MTVSELKDLLKDFPGDGTIEYFDSGEEQFMSFNEDQIRIIYGPWNSTQAADER